MRAGGSEDRSRVDTSRRWSRAHLTCDDAMLADTSNVWRSLHHPGKHGATRTNRSPAPVLAPDRPWEGYLVLQPGTVIYDEGEGCFKMWYNTQPSREKPDAGRNLCYAVSFDGLHWEKPELGIVEHDGSKANNIVLRGVSWTHCILKDQSAESADKLYKLLYWGRAEGDGNPGICAAFSANGINWNTAPENPVVPKWLTGDTFSFMRDPASGQYWLYHKTPCDPIRTVSRLVSEDFLHWRDTRRVFAPDALDPPDTQFYGLSAFSSGDQYLGLLWVYHTYGQTMDVQLVSSRDGIQWDRTADRKLLMPLVPCNRYGGGAFDSKMIYPASAPVERDGKLWLYYSGFTVPHNAESREHDGRIGLATLRRDGFCSLDATSPGEVLTRPFEWRGMRLLVNAVTRGPGASSREKPSQRCGGPGGSIRVQIEDCDGKIIPGLAAAHCAPFCGDSTEEVINWNDRSDLSRLDGSKVQLRFLVHNASLYAWYEG